MWDKEAQSAAASRHGSKETEEPLIHCSKGKYKKQIIKFNELLILTTASVSKCMKRRESML